jgi:hypothetical protein
VRREVAVTQPKANDASTDKPSVRPDQMAKKGSHTNTNAKGIFSTMQMKMKLQLLLLTNLVHLERSLIPITCR